MLPNSGEQLKCAPHVLQQVCTTGYSCVQVTHVQINT
jgi:hypothetical protein